MTINRSQTRFAALFQAKIAR